MTLRAPFPWFGGKSRASDVIWQRFGDPPNYVEPFAGSLAVLLARQDATQTETVNDRDAYLANFWRAVQADPDGVARHCDWPVNEADLLARHEWLVSLDAFRQRMRTDPEYFDVKVAGWWVWGICCWIGSGWCRERRDGHPPEQLPHLGDAGRGDALRAWFSAISQRMARVRVACGEWDRVLGESVTIKHGTTAILLDPPYSDDEHSLQYSTASESVADAVREWAITNGDHPQLRIALCGYDGEHEMPDDWECVEWKAHGGYGGQSDGRGRANSERERIWFSPACLSAKQPDLFRPRGRSAWEESKGDGAT